MGKFNQIAFLFPGQGAQAVGMGKDFYEAFSQAREVFDEADSLLNRHLTKILFEGPETLLTETRNSQTGIYVMSLAVLRVLQSQFPSLTPSFCAGLSLGEYTALTASQKVDFSSCLPVVQFRGEAMNAACEAQKGTMAAVFGLSAEQVETFVKELNLPEDLWVANFNCPGQTVLSGTVKGIEIGSEKAKALGAKRVIPLKVHGAFHSGLMSSAEKLLAPRLNSLEIQKTPISLVMNAPGAIIDNPEEIRQNLIRQVTSPVRWEQSIRSISPKADLFIEMGPGKVLSGLNKQNGVTAPTVNISQVADLETLATLLAS